MSGEPASKVPRLVADAEDEEGVAEEATHQAMNALSEVQARLEKLSEESNEEILQLEKKHNQLRVPLYKERTKYIANIPEFWASVLQHCPEIQVHIQEEDARVLLACTELFVEDVADPNSGYRVSMRFEENQYFRNDVLFREWRTDLKTGEITRISSPIDWNVGMDLTSIEGEPVPSFFGWFADDFESKGYSVEDVDFIGDVIKDEIWPNPLHYFLEVSNVQEDEEADEFLDMEGEQGDEEYEEGPEYAEYDEAVYEEGEEEEGDEYDEEGE